jgi:hypothetical protein
MFCIHTTLARSDIHGIGVFASEPIRKGQVVWRYSPQCDIVIGAEVLPTLPKNVTAAVHYYGYLNSQRGHYVLSLDNSRFTNHSLNPNVATVPGGPDAEGVDVATRHIAGGEELTMDYWSYDGEALRKLAASHTPLAEDEDPIALLLMQLTHVRHRAARRSSI